MSTETEVLQQMATQKLAGFVQAAIYDLSDGRRFPDLMAAVVELARRAEHAAAKADAAREAQATKDAEDARRLDWLTFNISGKALRDIGVIWSEHGDARRAIDAARTQTEIDMIGTQSTGAGANHA